MENNIIHSLNYGERVTSTYAEIYLDDLYCNSDSETSVQEPKKVILQQKLSSVITDDRIDDWKSPSDQIIDIIDLKPPFTSKITRGKTHEGILTIGNEVVENERAHFLKHVTNLIHENDAAWNYILDHEKSLVSKRVNNIYAKIFLIKSKTMTQEIDKFYESTLQEIEDHLKLEILNVLVSTHAAIICDLNTKIKEKLIEEKKIVEEVLKKRYEREIRKIKTYYTILINHELYRMNSLINKEIVERNDALKAFYKLVEAENMTSTMYIMSTERKKCKIKRFILDNYQNTEIAEKLQKIKQRQDVINAFNDKEEHISDINKEWEQKIQKILRLFLKFISFALKLLPEQTTFLLDLEKLVVLQLNEIQKIPNNVPCSILIDEANLKNIFKFEEPISNKIPCNKKPIIVVGDVSDPIPPKYGSRETLASNIDLPTITLQRQYVYAKCHKFEEIKSLLESQRCKCDDTPIREPSHVTLPSQSTESFEASTSMASESSYEPLLVDDIRRFEECPARLCNNWTKRIIFPYLDSYLDFTEENFKRVQTILGSKHIKEITPDFINAKDIAHKSLPFGSTNEEYRHAETQYSNDSPCERRRPRKLLTAKPSKYEASEAIQSNKKYWKDVFNKVDKSTTTRMNESKHLANVLPPDIYRKVCMILDIPVTASVADETNKIERKICRRVIKEPMVSFRKSLYIDRELDSDTDVELFSSDNEDLTDIHQDLLRKPEREQITWATRYLQPEREDEKTLIKKADDLTNRIANEFCEYMKQLGGDQQSKLFTPKAIKELFQIEFNTHVARSLSVIPKELPAVEDKIAKVTGNPDKSQYAALEREIYKDMNAERRSDHLRAFSRSLPLHEQTRAPRNNTKKLWRSARHVPKDLVTLKTVWEGITNLRSVKEYCRWMIEHPEYKRPPYLDSLGMFNPVVLEARLTFEAQDHFTRSATLGDTPAPLKHIRRRLSQVPHNI
ncbi:hypothetical protein K1T71_004998 [Dendrolimus kikuchii]|uniref:Uncharacterized protein n=1 Tax=Dendrolimus kikuchii TaxID=765133 RepID=A0ACC1D642_9NEOP|nr:hypothetical protein K1T71_004998 [Dendrolimus kikuchii]